MVYNNQLLCGPPLLKLTCRTMLYTIHEDMKESRLIVSIPSCSGAPSIREIQMERTDRTVFAQGEMVGPFKIGEKLGCGSYGNVRLGRHIEKGFKVVVKLQNKNV